MIRQQICFRPSQPLSMTSSYLLPALSCPSASALVVTAVFLLMMTLKRCSPNGTLILPSREYRFFFPDSLWELGPPLQMEDGPPADRVASPTTLPSSDQVVNGLPSQNSSASQLSNGLLPPTESSTPPADRVASPFIDAPASEVHVAVSPQQIVDEFKPAVCKPLPVAMVCTPIPRHR
jgi:hypothetical protein